MRLPVRIRMHLRDREIRYIDGNPEHPLIRGSVERSVLDQSSRYAERV